MAKHSSDGDGGNYDIDRNGANSMEASDRLRSATRTGIREDYYYSNSPSRLFCICAFLALLPGFKNSFFLRIQSCDKKNIEKGNKEERTGKSCSKKYYEDNLVFFFFLFIYYYLAINI